MLYLWYSIPLAIFRYMQILFLFAPSSLLPGTQLKCFTEWPKLKQLPWNLIRHWGNWGGRNLYSLFPFSHPLPAPPRPPLQISESTFTLAMWVWGMYGSREGLVGSGWFILPCTRWRNVEAPMWTAEYPTAWTMTGTWSAQMRLGQHLEAEIRQNLFILQFS